MPIFNKITIKQKEIVQVKNISFVWILTLLDSDKIKNFLRTQNLKQKFSGKKKRKNERNKNLLSNFNCQQES